MIGTLKWCCNFYWYGRTCSSFGSISCPFGKVSLVSVQSDFCVRLCQHDLIKFNVRRYFTGHSKNADGTVQFVKGRTSVSDAVDGVIKIVTVAVSGFCYAFFNSAHTHTCTYLRTLDFKININTISGHHCSCCCP